MDRMEYEILNGVRTPKAHSALDLMNKVFPISPVRRAVLDIVAAAPNGVSAGDVFRARGTQSRTAIDRLLHRMMQDGEIEKNGGRYFLTSSMANELHRCPHCGAVMRQ